MILRRSPPTGVLGAAIERAFAGFDHAPIDDLLAGSFWTAPAADFRWSQFAGQLPRGVVPARAGAVAAELRSALRAFTRK